MLLQMNSQKIGSNSWSKSKRHPLIFYLTLNVGSSLHPFPFLLIPAPARPPRGRVQHHPHGGHFRTPPSPHMPVNPPMRLVPILLVRFLLASPHSPVTRRFLRRFLVTHCLGWGHTRKSPLHPFSTHSTSSSIPPLFLSIFDKPFTPHFFRLSPANFF